MIKVTILELFSIYQNTVNNHAHEWGIPLQTRKRSNWLETNFKGGHTIELSQTKNNDDTPVFSLTVVKRTDNKHYLISQTVYLLLDSKHYV